MLPRPLSALWWKRYLSRNSSPADELERFPSLSPAQQRADLARRLRDQIVWFGSREDALPEWKEAARINDPDEIWRIWPHLPVVTKPMLRSHFPVEEVRRLCGLPGSVNATGGSTGEPTRFYHDREMLLRTQAAIYHGRRMMSWTEGMPVIIVWGSERDIGREVALKPRINAMLRNEYLLDAYNLTTQTARKMVDLALRMKPVAIYGFTSMLQFMAEEVLRQGWQVPPGTVQIAWNGGEMLFAEQSDVFQKAFGTPILNCYGGRELALMAAQRRAGGPLEIMRPWLFAEVVDQDGKPVQPGEPGRLLWTSTVCRGTPFLRYDIEDLASYSAEGADESGVRELRDLQGRVSGLLRLPDGRTINNIFWNHLFKEIPEVARFQVILRRDSVHVLLCGSGFTPDREQEVRRMAGNLLQAVRLTFEWVDKIPLTKQGKLVQVIRES
jgi:phenylacetate-CoA ligase